MKRLIGIIAATALAATIAVPAAAAPDKKGVTQIDIAGTATLEVFEGILRPGKVDGTVAKFRIVGNPNKGVIKHVGGLAIDGSAGFLADDFLKIRNFWIDPEAGTISGIVEGFGRADLFELDGSDLLFLDAASLAVFDDLSLTGMKAGEVVS